MSRTLLRVNIGIEGQEDWYELWAGYGNGINHLIDETVEARQNSPTLLENLQNTYATKQELTSMATLCGGPSCGDWLSVGTEGQFVSITADGNVIGKTFDVNKGGLFWVGGI
jgi:hypothetical protein